MNKRLTLKEVFGNFGLASPGILGNPFARRSSTTPEKPIKRVTAYDVYKKWERVFESVGITEKILENVDNPGLVKRLGEAVENWIKTREYGNDDSLNQDDIKTREYGDDDADGDSVNQDNIKTREYGKEESVLKKESVHGGAPQESANDLFREAKRLLAETDDILDLLRNGKGRYKNSGIEESRRLLRKSYSFLVKAFRPGNSEMG